MRNSTDFEEILEAHFPKSVRLESYIDSSRAALSNSGFNAENTLACVCACRDELTRCFGRRVEEVWGEAFDLSGLGGLFFAGATGLGAAMHHGPQVDGKERYVFYLLAHIGLGADGSYGVCTRPGRSGESSACGALCAFSEQWFSGKLNLEMDPDDLEQSLLRQRLARELSEDARPNLKELTKLAHDAAASDLKRLLERLVDTSVTDYALLTGVHIHGPEQNDYIWPQECFSVVEGDLSPLVLSDFARS